MVDNDRTCTFLTARRRFSHPFFPRPFHSCEQARRTANHPGKRGRPRKAKGEVARNVERERERELARRRGEHGVRGRKRKEKENTEREVERPRSSLNVLVRSSRWSRAFRDGIRFIANPVCAPRTRASESERKTARKSERASKRANEQGWKAGHEGRRARRKRGRVTGKGKGPIELAWGWIFLSFVPPTPCPSLLLPSRVRPFSSCSTSRCCTLLCCVLSVAMLLLLLLLLPVVGRLLVALQNCWQCS